jgi:glutathione S-transferase
MSSILVARFLESTYPNPPVPLTSEMGDAISAKVRAILAPVFAKSVMPREAEILSPRSAEYFRRTREPTLGRKLEDLLQGEQDAWELAENDLRGVAEMITSEGPFVLGAEPSYVDFSIAGGLQTARVVCEELWAKCMNVTGIRRIYEACSPFMDKKD